MKAFCCLSSRIAKLGMYTLMTGICLVPGKPHVDTLVVFTGLHGSADGFGVLKFPDHALVRRPKLVGDLMPAAS